MHKLSVLLILFTLFGFKPRANNKISADRIKGALAFCKKNKMDTTIAIMIDMSIHSGKNRIFVYDFKQKEITIEGLCAHGVGGGSTPTKPVFSNKEGSYCTSLGKYKVKGCPVLSDGTMRKIDVLLKTKKKPVLLWIYEEMLN